jgi:3'-phosphoadenosine 5'-phosphosulfate (PAPS) 3'-phosphatase
MPLVGVLGCPKLYKLNSEKYGDKEGYLFFAERGKGAFVKSLNEKTIQKIKVNQFNTIAEILYTESFDNSHININIHKQIADILNIIKCPLKIDSQIKYSLVASGDVSLYLKIPRPNDYKEYIWDNAAGQLIVEEAGGAVTDLSGNEIYYEKTDKLMKNSGIIASNKFIHNDVVKITSQLF